ncbi:MAG: ArsR/SmtB family transcription factor [Selenomonas sp.]|uniref:ArsR/SmtB family transcription factor n=1 Tax=uncultured Selenomonas sp. TaxID=159275 RepID=UPI0028E604B3|nr:metalloregulator ArsR/SmtB family transcription factor [uncultured Selenomonas sp.]
MAEDRELARAAEMLKALSHPVRLCIVRGLWQSGGCNVAHMQQCLEAPQSTISQHLAKLRAVGIIEGERNGLEVVYRLKSRAVEQLLEGLFCKEKNYHDMG